MSLLSTFKKFVYNSTVKKQLKSKTSFKKKAVSYDAAKYIALLFDASDTKLQSKILQYADTLTRKGKIVKIFAYINQTAKEKAPLPFEYINKNDLNWFGVPKQHTIDKFLSAQYDILINMSFDAVPALEYVATLAQAHLKVAPYQAQNLGYDLLIDLNNSRDVEQFIHQAELFMSKLTTSQQHEKNYI